MLRVRTLLQTVMIQGVGVVGTMLISVVIARRLGASGQGFWVQFRSILDLVAAIAAFGFPMAFPFLVNVRKVSDRRLLRFTFVYGISLAPLVAAGLWLVSACGLMQLASSTPATEITLLVIAAVAMTIHSMIRGLALATSPSWTFNLMTAVPPLMTLLLAISWPMSHASALMSMATFAVWLALFVCMTLWWRFRYPDAGRMDVELPVREMVSFGGWNFVVSLATAAVPVLTIQWLRMTGATADAIGCFSVALLIQGALLTPANMAGPLVYNAWSADSDSKQIRRTYARLMRWSFPLALAAAGLCAALLPGLLPLIFGSSFDAALNPAWLLLLGVPVGYLIRLVANALLAAGYAKFYAFASVLRLAAVALVFSALGGQTITQAAVAWVVADLASLIYLAVSLKRQGGWTAAEVAGFAVSARQC